MSPTLFSDIENHSYVKAIPPSRGEKLISVVKRVRSLMREVRPAENVGFNAQDTTPPPSAQRRILPLRFNNSTYKAVPDYGAGENVIEEPLAMKLGADINYSAAARTSFMNAQGGTIKSIGTATLKCSFPNEPRREFQCVFRVLRKMVVPLIMGRKFLIKTKTLSDHPERLQYDTRLSDKFWRLFHLAKPQSLLRCSVDSQEVLANADTGSDIDLASLEFAIAGGYTIHPAQQGRDRVLFADGECVKLRGTIDVELDIMDGATQQPSLLKSRSTRLHVLEGLTSDILLGDETLVCLEAFTKYQESFVDIDSTYHYTQLQYITWYNRVERRLASAFSKSQKQGDASPSGTLTSSPIPAITSKPSTFHKLLRKHGKPAAKNLWVNEMDFERQLEARDLREQHRRTRAERNIQTLVGAESAAARQQEQESQRRYDDERRAMVRRQNDLLAERLDSGTGTGTDSGNAVESSRSV
ncbi:hypothetical protein EPUS_05242 [Endocarpon pusillum Z07020]|uniref:Uncharacterized protein n=1 Tax=Endocarpon pusillum (strain Z07020 / HMAS-L-300199) TaxID=1263415 RepID=U1G919_ENDPU|nr:uncharacterized protein EPUS_05242 [Endocarpon pusillum Z07020]ERF68161.1 hypothetical protein EPUS_05242 [Endocarpon pusillum Z07020]